MGSYEPNIDIFMLELDYDNQAKIIPLDVENISLISNMINLIKLG